MRKRKKTCGDIPEVGDALANGATTGERVDTLAKATAGCRRPSWRRSPPRVRCWRPRPRTPTERQYRETIERVVGKARGDDGLDRLAKQRKAVRLRWWSGPDGMWRFTGGLDAVRGTELEGRLRNAIEALFHGKVPDDAPTDPIERQEYLAALALVALVEGKAPASGVPDVTVLIDEKTLLDGHRHEHSIVDVGLGRFGLPVETIRRWACIGAINPVVVSADGVRIYLGRETTVGEPPPTTRAAGVVSDVCVV